MPPIALVYRLSDWPLAPLLFDMAELPAKLQGLTCYVHAEVDGFAPHLFERLPEQDLGSDETELVHLVHRALREAGDGLLQRVVFAEGRPGEVYLQGFHTSALLEEVAAEFARDGFEVVQLSDEMARRGASGASTEEASLQRARESLEGCVESEAGKAAAAWIFGGTPIADGLDLRGCLPEFPLSFALNPRVEHWNEVDLRVLDVWVRTVEAPGAIEFTQTPYFEEFEDRHRVVREALAARGVDPERIRADSVAMLERSGFGSIETNPCSNSLRLWLLREVERLVPTWKELASSEHPGRGDWLLYAALHLARVPRVVDAVKELLADEEWSLAVGAKPWCFLLDASQEEDPDDPVNLEFVKTHLERIAAVADPSVRYVVACALADRTGDDAERRAAVEDCLRTRADVMETSALWAPFRDACTMNPKLSLEHLVRWIGREQEAFEEFVSIAADELPAKVPDLPELREQLEGAAAKCKKKRTKTQLEAIAARMAGSLKKKKRTGA